jgi:Zn-dependent protease
MKNWAIKLGAFAGIDVYLHLTFLLLIGFFAFSYWIVDGSVGAALQGVLFYLALFGCVLLHEYGHALTARRFGIRTRDITLYPIGGVARLERLPDRPIEELWVALAGPAVNVVIAALALVVITLSGGPSVSWARLLAGGDTFLERLLSVNLSLVLFNLIPAFPMDGGRVLRALLASRLDYARATQIAAGLGQAFALLFGFVGLLSNPTLIFIAFFVWIAAAQEASMAQMKSSLSGIPVSRAMLTDFRALHPIEPLSRVVEHILAGSQQDFPVVEEGRVVGVLTRADLLAALAQRGPVGAVGHIMRRDLLVVDSFEMLEPVFMRLQEQGLHTAPVVHRGQLVGLLTSENVGEFLMIQAVLGQRR